MQFTRWLLMVKVNVNIVNCIRINARCDTVLSETGMIVHKGCIEKAKDMHGK